MSPHLYRAALPVDPDPDDPTDGHHADRAKGPESTSLVTHGVLMDRHPGKGARREDDIFGGKIWSAGGLAR